MKLKMWVKKTIKKVMQPNRYSSDAYVSYLKRGGGRDRRRYILL